MGRKKGSKNKSYSLGKGRLTAFPLLNHREVMREERKRKRKSKK